MKDKAVTKNYFDQRLKQGLSQESTLMKGYLDQALNRLAASLHAALAKVSLDSENRDDELAEMTKRGFDHVNDRIGTLEQKVDNIMLFEIGQLKKDANITNQRLNYLEQAVGMSGK